MLLGSLSCLALHDRLHVDPLLLFKFHCIHIFLFRSVGNASIHLIVIYTVLVSWALHDLSFQHYIKLSVFSLALGNLNASPLDEDEHRDDSD